MNVSGLFNPQGLLKMQLVYKELSWQGHSMTKNLSIDLAN